MTQWSRSVRSVVGSLAVFASSSLAGTATASVPPPGDKADIDAAAARAGLDAFIAYGDDVRDGDDYPAVIVDVCAFGPWTEWAGVVGEVVAVNEGAANARFTHAWVNWEAPGGTGCRGHGPDGTPEGIHEITTYGRLIDGTEYAEVAQRDERWERTAETAEPWLGGELRSFCWRRVGDSGSGDDCAAHWVASRAGFVIELELHTNDASATADQARTALRQALPLLAGNLAVNVLPGALPG